MKKAQQKMHRLLADQLKNVGGDKALWKAVSDTYTGFEHEIHRLNDAVGRIREETKKQLQRRFELAVEAASDGIWDYNVQTRVMWFSSRFKEMLGYEPNSLMESRIEDWYALIHPEDIEKARELIDSHLEGDGQSVRTLRIRHSTGAIYYFMCRITVSRDASGRITNLIGLQTNITDLISMQEELAVARDRAEAASRAKSDFLANMSHEIRSPMNSIMGMTGLLLDTPLNPQQRLWAEIVRNSSELLLDIINDILDISKIEAEKLILEKTSFDLFEIIEHATDTLMLKAQEKNIELLTSYAPDTPRFLAGDPTRLRQIIINLVGNAIKFTSEGYVVLSVSLRGIGDNKAHLFFEIEDTGIGIPPDKLEHIFEKFSQADTSTTRKFGGTGLGLTICRRLVQRMEGAIGVKSETGKGSTFYFDIHLPIDAHAVNPEQAASPELHELKIMVADDNPKSLDILRRYFTAWGMQAEFHDSAEPALQSLAQARQKNAEFNIVMVDYHLRGMNGKAFAEEIRKRGIGAPQLIALKTGDPGNLSEMRDAGFSAVVLKPFSPSRLMNKLSILWNHRSHRRHNLLTRHNFKDNRLEAQNRKPVDLAALKILIVEDIKANQIYLQAVLKKYNCVADIAVHGKDAVEKAKSRLYDIIFMDCQMPEMDGYEATRVIRALPLSSRPFIIALTADAMQGDREKCLAAGMDEYMNKPVTGEKIVAMLESYVRLHEAERLAG